MSATGVSRQVDAGYAKFWMPRAAGGVQRSGVMSRTGACRKRSQADTVRRDGPIEWIRRNCAGVSAPARQRLFDRHRREPGAEVGRALPPGAAVIDLGCGPGFPIPRFWSPKASARLELMQHHLSSKLSNAISRTHRRLRSRPGFEILRSHFRWCPGVGTRVPAFARGPAPPYREDRRDAGARGPAAVYVSCGTNCLERCDDRIGITLPWSRGVPSAHFSSWSLCRQ
jgi:hypothetical protein